MLNNRVLLLLIFFSINVYTKSYNTLGQVGLINLPSAEIMEEQSVYFTFKKDDYTKTGTLTVTPFNWLEASYFYYRPDDTFWGGKLGSNLDKGFNIKLSYKPENIYLPRFAVGLDDFSGTGKFTKEYIATTYNFKKFNLTTGVGWGKFVGNHHIIENPFSFISNKFNYRPGKSDNYNLGGSPAYDMWFRGDSVFFGGIEFPIDKKNKFTFKIESNPFDYYKFGEGAFSDKSYELRNSKSKINYGLNYKFNNFGSVNLFYVKGDTLTLSFSFGFSSKKPLRKKNEFSPKISNTNHMQKGVDEFYYDLLENLNNNRLYLQTADLSEKDLSLTIDSAEIANPIQSSSRAAFIAEKILEHNQYYSINQINVGTISRGIQLNNITFNTNDLKDKNNYKTLVKKRSELKKISPLEYERHDFKPKVLFPIMINNISPDIRLHLGSPERFQYSGFGIKLTTEVQVNRNLSINSVIAQDLSNTFDKKVSAPTSSIPLVRTEIVEYLQNSDDLNVRVLQLDYIAPVYNDIYARISAGYLEQMFGGFSSEILYKPFDYNFAASFEVNKVKKRGYKGRFDFLDYDTTTAHINTAYYYPKANILLKLSYGKYLAQDVGYTFDLSRRMPSGWQAGFYFTRTNLSAEEFGEGSFDKGFYINIPLNIFQKKYSKKSNGFAINPLTRDGGQRLNIQNKLIDSFYGSSFNEINENWESFLD